MGAEIGVLALQGDVSEHVLAFRTALGGEGGHVRELRDAKEIGTFDAIALPGGESTTIARLIDKNRMREALRTFEGGIFATCAGLVLVAEKVVDDERFQPLGILEIEVERNAFGRQKDSFEADLTIRGLLKPFHAVFIRAPIGRRAGPHAEVLAEIDRGFVAVRQGLHMAFAFHPELSGDLRLHKIFLAGLEDS
ncbi:MAG: pyridoxal 5'-phosphate synthase glutaminase subunit PdxT [Methanobacteriota archaeon]|nr:MAG: pyridoxal 5'-phosphate synthase glutaminase subunit PdxT [Euryarchaeota archaeon]